MYFTLAALEPVIRGLRWHYILGNDSAIDAIKGLYISKTGNNILPLRLGDAVRVQFIKDRGNVSYSTSLPSILTETFLDLAALAVIAIIYSLLDTSFSSIGYLIFAALCIALLAFFLITKFNLTEKYSGQNRLIILTLKMAKTIPATFLSKGIVPIILTTLFLWVFILLMTFSALEMMLPFVSIQGVISTLIFTYLVAIVPSAPGFVGTYHAAISAGIIVMGYSIADYAALPILVHIVQYIPQTSIGIIIGFSYLFNNNWKQVRLNIYKYYKNS